MFIGLDEYSSDDRESLKYDRPVDCFYVVVVEMLMPSRRPPSREDGKLFGVRFRR